MDKDQIKKRVAEIKGELAELEKKLEDNPDVLELQPGDIAKFWDDEEEKSIIADLVEISDEERLPYTPSLGAAYKRCENLTLFRGYMKTADRDGKSRMVMTTAYIPDDELNDYTKVLIVKAE